MAASIREATKDFLVLVYGLGEASGGGVLGC